GACSVDAADIAGNILPGFRSPQRSGIYRGITRLNAGGFQSARRRRRRSGSIGRKQEPGRARFPRASLSGGSPMFASGNPALSPEKFGSNPYGVNYADLDRREAKLRQMTLQGTINNTALSLGVVVVTAGLTWTMLSGGLWIAALVIGALAGLVLSLIIAMKPTTAPFLTLPYAAAEGAFVGGL